MAEYPKNYLMLQNMLLVYDSSTLRVIDDP